MSKPIPGRGRWRRTSSIKAVEILPEERKQMEEPVKKKLKGRPPKVKRFCTWCRESRIPLPYVFPCSDGKKEFCSESCLAEFSKASRTRKVSESNEQIEEKVKEKEEKIEEALPSVNSSEDSKPINERRHSAGIPSQPTTPTKEVISTPAEKQHVSLSTEKEAATSTTQSPVGLEVDPNQWSVENVIQYISSSDQLLTKYADLFYKHEIDGRAFLLLNFDMMMKYMGLKLGPALKICNLINKLTKGRRL